MNRRIIVLRISVKMAQTVIFVSVLSALFAILKGQSLSMKKDW